MSEELKPCPFCGSRNVNDTTPPPDMSDCEEQTYYWVCPDCVCCGPIAESVELATKAWNARHVPEGYKLVPIEPTEYMKGKGALKAWELEEKLGTCEGKAGRVYKAMIEAEE